MGLPAVALRVISCIGVFPHIVASGIVVHKHQAPASNAAGLDYDHLRHSVLRVQASYSDFDWLQPFVPSADALGLGSAFVVQTEPYPLFVTNAHVISDASHVTLQLLLYGNHEWEAQVVAVCSKFDVALMVLKDPDTFHQALTRRNMTLHPLKLAAGSVSMGDDVIALGFPLGHNSLKISKGNIAGFETIDSNICIQSTAPISPGSSGGPLLDRTGQAVVGVNFAKATEGENINYVIPAWRVSQMVAHHLKQQPNGTESGWKRLQVEIPPHDLTIIEANDALHLLEGGCEQGVYISRVRNRSFFKHADPPVPKSFFLVSVNGKELDRFGTGLDTDYIADRVDFLDLFHMLPDLSGDVQVQTCVQGNTTTHSIPMAWKPEYDRGVRFVSEPHQSGMARAYEMFSGLSIMEMTWNHISAVLNQYGDPGPARWLHPDLAGEPRLVINYVKQGSYAWSFIDVGSVVAKVNGHPVRTLDEYRKHFLPDKSDVWTLETDLGSVYAVMFNETLADQLHEASYMNNPYLRTQSVVQAARALGMDVLGPDGPARRDVAEHLESMIRDLEANGPEGFPPEPKEATDLQAWGKATRKVPPSHPNLASTGLAAASPQIAGAVSAAIVGASPTAGVPPGPPVRAAGPLNAQRAVGQRGRITGQSAKKTAWHLPRV